MSSSYSDVTIKYFLFAAMTRKRRWPLLILIKQTCRSLLRPSSRRSRNRVHWRQQIHQSHCIHRTVKCHCLWSDRDFHRLRWPQIHQIRWRRLLGVRRLGRKTHRNFGERLVLRNKIDYVSGRHFDCFPTRNTLRNYKAIAFCLCGCIASRESNCSSIVIAT